MTKKVLIALSEHGFWVEELMLPLKHLQNAGFEVDFVTPTGQLPFPDGASLDSTYVDPPLGRTVTSSALAEIGERQDWGVLFADRMNLKDWFPVRPYLSADNYIGHLEMYYEQRAKAWENLGDYDALLLVGGSGPIVDMVNNQRIHDLILGFYYADKPIAAECYTVTCLAFARELDSRKSIIAGKHVTGHTMEYDYTDGWSIVANGDYLNFGAPPFSLEYILRDSVGQNGQFHGNVGRKTSVILDYPFLTSRSVASSDLCGKVLVECLTEGVRKYGWK
ncbi:type 1 glutamine amidotransferase domain-containing protein [Bacillus solimangrovi]|uniref:Thiamine biosynthesis protein ThiJ n=1 Tax=Bacillus solimangrovi TaxID=1305675 RepID=A0A1E5LID8_9BACI|nr:type 1 glutamine amidotransferase domain-containing protein [Bacillus solimangrovi]OEH93835.1 thiamine biosynthesis protein ThiJ [Bacillus solimangrovi]